MTLPEKMYKIMQDKNISKADLAKKLNISYSTVQSWIKRNSDPGSAYIEDIANALNVSIEYLITGREHIAPGTVLPPAEQQLLDYYHAANTDGQKQIIDHAEYISAKYPRPAGKSSECKIG